MTRSLSVLLVEDDDPLRGVLAELLASCGWNVFPTGFGPEAVRLARSNPIDFSIVDLHLPGMTGLEVLLSIRREGRLLPAIMMSGQASAEETTAALNAGVFSFLRKPLDLDRLRVSLDQLVQQHFGFPPGFLAPPHS
jgi:DNA-binding response OmpR family regulator